MATVVDNFLNKFQCLAGTTVADRQKNYFKLLHEIAPLVKDNVEALDAISSNLNPQTYLESLFRVDFLIYFRRTQELLNLLKEGNDVFVSKITKQIWFFKEVLGDVPAEQLVNEVLPCMSYSVRMKVLRKLSRYAKCDKFEEMYDVLVNRYGIYLASQFITGCGPAKVRQILRDYPLKLSSTQLRIMYGKDRELIDFYFSHTKYSFNANVYKSLIRFIYDNDPNLFDYLKDKYNISIRLGRRATKKLVVTKNDEVVKNPYAFNHLNMKAVLRKIGSDSAQLFTNALPLKIERCINRDWVFRCFPKKYHYSLYIQIFQAHYNIKLADYPALIDEELLRLIPEDTERAALAKVKVDRGCDEYIKYLLIEDSVKLIKEKINLTSDIYERGKLIKYLIDTCHINNDIDALFEVMEYFCFRHKNDELNVHLQFINNIENLFGFKKFTEQMWDSLNELLTIHLLKFDQSQSTYEKIQTMPLLSFNLGTSHHQKLSYLEFLFRKGDSIDALIKEYFTTNNQFPIYRNYDKDFGKYFLLFTINNVAQQTGERKDINFNCNLISEINSWNDYCKEDQLSFYDYPVLLHAFNYIIRNDSLWGYNQVFTVFRNKIFTTKHNDYKSEYMQIYWERHDTLAKLTDLKWFLKYDPLTVVTYFEIVFNQLTKTDTNSTCFNVWRQIKKFSHLQLDEKSVQLCLAKLSDEKCTDMKPKFIPALSILMKPGDYAVLADSYKPENKKLDLKNEKEVRLYNLQCSIGMHFKNTKSYQVLSSLLNYCAGDYFKYAMRSLYSLLYRTPEYELPRYLNYLSKKAVSVRKHALYMTCELSTSANVESMLKLLNKQEEVQSLKKHMFTTTIQYFVKNPTYSFFELVKLNMLFISKADDESLQSIPDNLPNIPKKYKAQYILHAWQHLENTVDVWEKLSPLKDGLLSCVDLEIAREIPLEFGIRIIQQHFLTENNTRDLGYTYTFMFNFLSSKDEKNTIFEKIFTVADHCKSKDEVFKFLHNWYNYRVMRSASNDLKYMEPYVTYFEKQVSLTEHFSDYIKIFFLKSKVNSECLSVDDFAKKILIFFEEVVSNCGPYVIHLFAREMNSNLGFFTGNNVTENDFYFSMMKQRGIPIVAALLLQVVSRPSDYQRRSTVAFHEFLQQIKNIEDIGVQICLQSRYNSYLRILHASSTSEMEIDEES